MNGRRLLFGFGGLLLLIALTGGFAVLDMRRYHLGNQQLRRETAERTTALQQIREAVLLSAALASDALLTPESAPELRRRIEALSRRSSADMQFLTRAGETTEIAGLRADLKNYWSVVELMAEVTTRERRRGVDDYFRTELAKRRESMLAVSQRAAKLLAAESRIQEQKLEQMFQAALGRVIAGLLAALAAGTVVAVLTGRRLIQAEEAAERHRRNLEALSARVVSLQEDERRAVARELHDGIAQVLSAQLIDIGGAIGRAQDPDVRSRLESARSLGQQCLQAVREMAMNLRPSILDDLGLVPAIEWFAREIGRRFSVEVKVSAGQRDLRDLPDEIKTCIFRVTQEAVTNSARHSGASSVQVSLHEANGHVTLAVEDNGRGFDPEKTRGLGLMGMYERVQRVGGEFQPMSHPGGGTRIDVRIPVPMAALAVA
ncbi:MAG: sensor histidine kinase [Bryobacteraceae bacterium]